MTKVLVLRTGSPLWWGIMSSNNASETGECDTEPTIRWLAAQGYDVGFYGMMRNFDNTIPLRIFDVNMSRLKDESLSPEQFEEKINERCFPVIQDVIDWNPDVCIEFCGDCYTWYSPCNPNKARILDQCWKFGYIFGQFYHRTKYKRNLIITDPNVYPKHGEMVTRWPECFPNTVLSQESLAFDRRIQGRNFVIKPVYSGCENWLTWQMRPVDPRGQNKSHEVVIAANSHHKKAGQHESYRQALWRNIIEQAGESVRICGRGWDDYPEYADKYVGVLPSFQQVMSFMQTGIGGPVVCQKNGFNSTKARLYALNGAVPYLFDRDDAYRYCYDRDARYLPLDHFARWDWRDGRPPCMDLTESQRLETIHTVLHRTTPDFTMLENLISDRGDNSSGRYGGYIRV